MGWSKALIFVGGMATAGLAKLATGSKAVRGAAVQVTAKALDARDAIQEATQNVKDEADDVRAEADRQRKIDAAVAERLATLEEGIREEVTAEVDGKPVKKASARSKK